MKFKLETGKLTVTDVKHDERGRLANIDLAIGRAVVSMLHNPLIDGETSFEFAPEKTEAVREVLRSFKIDVKPRVRLLTAALLAEASRNHTAEVKGLPLFNDMPKESQAEWISFAKAVLDKLGPVSTLKEETD